mgnify:CR=1 FL=1
MKTEDAHNLVANEILNAIEKHIDAHPHIVAHALISIGMQLARDSAPAAEVADQLINVAMEKNGTPYIWEREHDSRHTPT